MTVSRLLLYAIALQMGLGTATALAWDPIGDLTNPGRIIENIGREAGNAVEDIPNVPRNVGREIGNLGRDIDRWRLELQAQGAAPVLQQWLIESRNSAASGAQPMPPHIRQQLQGYYDDDVLNRARYKVGDAGVINLAHLSIDYGDAEAVTLIDVIVFANGSGVEDPALWAHELKHVQQFRDWGVRDFAIRYIRSWNSVENDAYAAQNSYPEWRQRQLARYQPAPSPNFNSGPGFNNGPGFNSGPVFNPGVASACATPFGFCPMMAPIPFGASCYCMTPGGPVWGFGR